jgi:hypothetical protein
VRNAACLHSAAFTFTVLSLEDDAQFPSIAQTERHHRQLKSEV